MKIASMTMCLALMTASAAAAQNYSNYAAPGYTNSNPGIKPHGFADLHLHPSAPPAPLPGPSYHSPSRRPAFAPLAPIVGPPAKPFKPYGDYSGGGGPRAPKPPGYLDIYGTKRSQHPFLN